MLCAVPVEIDRDDAREAAARELSRSEYADAQPSLAERLVDWIAAHLQLDAAGAPIGTLIVVLLILVVAIVVHRRLGGTLHRHAREAPVFTELVEPVARYRDAAEAAARRGDHTTAVRERFRAIARSLEERGVLEPRPGRTADEVAIDAGALLPTHRRALADGAALFDAVHYGDRSADAAAYAFLVELDTAVSGAINTAVSGARIGPDA